MWNALANMEYMFAHFILCNCKIPYHGQSSRPHPDGPVVEQSAYDPLGLMGKLVAHHLQDVVHGRLAAVLHVVHARPVGQQQIHYVRVRVLTSHVQGSVFVLVHGVHVGPGLQQHLAHLEEALQLPRLLGLRTGGDEGREALVVLLVHRGAVAQVELRVAREAVAGRHV